MKNLLIALVIPFLAVACSSDKDEQKLEVTRENLAGEWKMNGESHDGEAIEVDDQTYHVNQNSILVLHQYGHGEPLALRAPTDYTLKNDIITFYGALEFKVKTLTKSTLVVVDTAYEGEVVYSFTRVSSKNVSEDEMNALYKKGLAAKAAFDARHDKIDADRDKILAMNEAEQQAYVKAMFIEEGDIASANNPEIVADEAAYLDAVLNAAKAAEEVVIDD